MIAFISPDLSILPHCCSRHVVPRRRIHLPRFLQLAAQQADASGEQVVCGEQGDNDQPLVLSHVQVAKGGVSGRGGALDTPSNFHGGSVGIGYPHLEEDG